MFDEIKKRNEEMEEFLKNDIGNVSASQQHKDRAWLIQRVEELEKIQEESTDLLLKTHKSRMDLQSQLAKKNKALEPFDKSYNWYVKGRKKWNMPIETEDRIAFDDPNYPLYLSHFRKASEAYDGNV